MTKLTDRLDRVAWRRNMVFGRLAMLQSNMANITSYEREVLTALEVYEINKAIGTLQEIYHRKPTSWEMLKFKRKKLIVSTGLALK